MTLPRFGWIKSNLCEFSAITLLAVVGFTTAWSLVDHVVSRAKSSFPAFIERVANIAVVHGSRRILVLNSRNNSYNAILIGKKLSVNKGHGAGALESHKAFLVHQKTNSG